MCLFYNLIKSQSFRGSVSQEKTPILGKIEGKKRKGATEDEVVEWHH